MSHRLLAACLAAALACGHEPAPSPAPSPTPPDTGGTPGGGTPPPTGPPPTSPPPSDPSVTIRRIDDAAECDGLLPSSALPAVTAQVMDADASCGPGLSEGGGHVAVVVRSGRNFEEFQVFSPHGEPEHRFEADMSNLCFLPTTCGPLLPQADGFIAAAATGGTGSHDPLLVRVDTFSADGTLLHSEEATTPQMGSFGFSLQQDPLGGALLVANGLVPPGMVGAGTCTGHTFRVGADGRPRGHADFGCHLIAAGVSNAGESLVLESRDADQFHVFLHWQEPDGSFAQPETSEIDPFTFGVHLAPLLQGGLVGNDGGRWSRRYPHLGAASEPAPDWLASRTGWAFRFTRGNKGYALFPPPGQELVDCAPGVEIRSVSGRLCGTITFREEGGPCRTAPIDQGWDGTVVQQSGRDGCSYRWWPKLLAGD